MAILNGCQCCCVFLCVLRSFLTSLISHLNLFLDPTSRPLSQKRPISNGCTCAYGTLWFPLCAFCFWVIVLFLSNGFHARRRWKHAVWRTKRERGINLRLLLYIQRSGKSQIGSRLHCGKAPPPLPEPSNALETKETRLRLAWLIKLIYLNFPYLCSRIICFAEFCYIREYLSDFCVLLHF